MRMAVYQTVELKESKNEPENTVKLDNQQVSISQFNETLKGLKKNQRVVEVADHDFHIVERMFS